MPKWTTPKSVRNGNAAIVVPIGGVILVILWIVRLGS